eukprot:361288-Chlamydomonas_euryale.AAC.2
MQGMGMQPGMGVQPGMRMQGTTQPSMGMQRTMQPGMGMQPAPQPGMAMRAGMGTQPALQPDAEGLDSVVSLPGHSHNSNFDSKYCMGSICRWAIAVEVNFQACLLFLFCEFGNFIFQLPEVVQSTTYTYNSGHMSWISGPFTCQHLESVFQVARCIFNHSPRGTVCPIKLCSRAAHGMHTRDTID